MSKLQWDKDSERLYETGVSQGVLYVKQASGTYGDGIAWNGLTGVTESPSGAEMTALYADNIKYLNLRSAEEFGATITAYTYPPEFEECNGAAAPVKGVWVGQQARKSFGFCYRTIIGNDTEGEAHGYKLHLIYGCDASPSERAYGTVNENPDAIEFSWEISTTPVSVSGLKPTAILTISSTENSADKMKALEDILYGTDGTTTVADGGETTTGTAARLPLPDEVIALMGNG